MSEIPPGTDQQISNIPTNVRHFLWNDDYIELLSHLLDLQKVKTLVDIGAGLGYLSNIFALYMKPGAKVLGFDLDAEAIRQARERAAAHPFSVDFNFEVADATHLPVADGSADLAICQHVLSQLPNPAEALAEMVRVVRPGGRVVAFEPNAMTQSLVQDSVSDDYTLDQRLSLVRYQYYYELGRMRLGAGDASIGDHLPRLFLEAGLKNLQVRLSDKAVALIPPYDTDEKQARARELVSWASAFETNRDFIRGCFLQGGGTPEEFDRFSAWELEQNARIVEQIRREEFIYPGGMLTYIVIGQKA